MNTSATGHAGWTITAGLAAVSAGAAVVCLAVEFDPESGLDLIAPSR